MKKHFLLILVTQFCIIIILLLLLFFTFTYELKNTYFYTFSDANFLVKSCVLENIEITTCEDNSLVIFFTNDIDNGEGYFFQQKQRCYFVSKKFNSIAGKYEINFDLYCSKENKFTKIKSNVIVPIDVNKDMDKIYLPPDMINLFNIKAPYSNISTLKNSYVLEIKKIDDKKLILTNTYEK